MEALTNYIPVVSRTYKEILLFCTGTLCYTYLFWMPIVFTTTGRLRKVAFHVGAWGPILTASTLTYLEGGKDAAWGLLGRAYNVENLTLELCAKAVLVPALVTAVAVILALYVPYGVAPLLGNTQERVTALLISPVLLVFFLGLLVTEEAGWRGYLQPRAEAYFGVPLGTALVSFMWSAWHLPWFFWSNMESAMYVEGPRITRIRYALVYVLGPGLTSISFLIVWFQKHTNDDSYFLAILAHASMVAATVACGAKSMNNLIVFIGLVSLPVVYVLLGMECAVVVGVELVLAAVILPSEGAKKLKST